MSLTHSFCLVIIVLCHYVAMESTESEPEEENQLLTLISKEIQPAVFTWVRGIVPYYIDQEHYDSIIIKRIHRAMQTIESISCVLFKELGAKPPPGEHPGYFWLNIQNPDGVRECSHNTILGNGPRAILVVGYDCMQQRDILHALMHVLGFKDEVTHPQRDMYIRILWPNIQTKYRSLFWMRQDYLPHKLMVEYDTMSIMHFHERAYSANGGATIAPLISGLLINPSDNLSQLDVMKLRLTFGHECNKRKVGNLLQTCQNALKGDDEGSSGDDGEISDDQDGSKERGIGSNVHEVPLGVMQGKKAVIKQEESV